METIHVQLVVLGIEDQHKSGVRPALQQTGSLGRPELYAPGWARCPRCRIEYLYHAILYPWCPGCCDTPGET